VWERIPTLLLFPCNAPPTPQPSTPNLQAPAFVHPHLKVALPRCTGRWAGRAPPSLPSLPSLPPHTSKLRRPCHAALDGGQAGPPQCVHRASGHQPTRRRRWHLQLHLHGPGGPGRRSVQGLCVRRRLGLAALGIPVSPDTPAAPSLSGKDGIPSCLFTAPKAQAGGAYTPVGSRAGPYDAY